MAKPNKRLDKSKRYLQYDTASQDKKKKRKHQKKAEGERGRKKTLRKKAKRMLKGSCL